jgi:hypothetical protein
MRLGYFNIKNIMRAYRNVEEYLGEAQTDKGDAPQLLKGGTARPKLFTHGITTI